MAQSSKPEKANGYENPGFQRNPMYTKVSWLKGNSSASLPI
jgi:hypothetical protein